MLNFLSVSKETRLRLELKRQAHNQDKKNATALKKVKLNVSRRVREEMKAVHSNEADQLYAFCRAIVHVAVDLALSPSNPSDIPSAPFNPTRQSVATPSPTSSIGKGKNHPSKHLSWVKHRAPLIFMALHPQIYNKNYTKAADIGGVDRSTVSNWMKQDFYRAKWYEIVKNLTWKQVN